MRGAAVQALTHTATAADLTRLVESLQRDHEQLNVLSSALQVLAAARGDVVTPMIELLRDPAANLRMHAALVLGHLNDGQAVPALVLALHDEDANVRFHAVEALGRIRADQAVPELAVLAASGDFFLAFPAIDALGRIGDPAALPALIDLLANDMLRPAAVDALGGLGHTDAVLPLVERLNAGDADAAGVAVALNAIHGRCGTNAAAPAPVVDMTRRALSPAGVARLMQALTQRQAPLGPLAVILGWMGPCALPALVTVLGDPIGEPEVQAAVADAIAALGGEAVTPLIERLHSGEREACAAAAAVLGRLGDRRAVPALIDLLSAADEELVIAAAAALARLGDPRALDALLLLFSASSAAVRHGAIAAVLAIDAPGTEALILARLAHAERHVRESAVRVIASSRSGAAAESILHALDDEHEDVRRAAIDGLPLIDDPRGTGWLLAALREETPRNRAAAAHALRGAPDGAEEGLIAALGDADSWVRYFAADSLAAHGGAAAVAALAALVAGDPGTHVRLASLRTLAVLDPSAASRVAARHVHSEDYDLACAALAVVRDAAGARGPDAAAEDRA